MNGLRLYQRMAGALALVLVPAFLYAAYDAINDIVAEQSRLQQQALSPVYKLVRDELLRPLYIAETLASSIEYTTGMESGAIDEDVLLARLARMQRDLDLVFFVASERARRQYLSSGRTLELVEGEVQWYFEAMEQDKDFMADLGQVGDVHLFFDVTVRDEEGEFLGYVGVGKPIKVFLDTFDDYKAQYDYDFLFVNEVNEILLTSKADLVVTDAYIPTLDTLDWIGPDRAREETLDSELIEADGEDFLITEFSIEELDWRLLLLVPLDDRQTQITQSFFRNALLALIIVVLLAGTTIYLLLLYKRGLEVNTETDALTGLPNRSHLERRFNQLRRAKIRLCVIIIDLDHFKQINDSHGHLVGDQVLKTAAESFQQGLREMDLVGRWGGEEFVMLIPAVSLDLGRTVAERARITLEALTVDATPEPLRITASFGIAFDASGTESFEDLISEADAALYEAKRRGRNRVEPTASPEG